MRSIRAFPGFIAWLAFTPLLLAQAPGSLDPTFLPNIQTPALAGTNFSELITLPDGKLLVAGFVNGDFKGAVRLYADGNVDSTFSVGSGAESADQGAGVFCGAVQSDGRVILGGKFERFNGVSTPGGLVRLRLDGSVDSSFSQSVAFSGFTPNALALLPDERLLVVRASNQIHLHKNDGTPDAAVPLYEGSLLDIRSVAVTGDGDVVFANNFLLWDESTGTGQVRLMNSRGEVLRTAEIQGTSVRQVSVLADGRILLGGSFTNVAGVDIANVVILKSDLTVDTTFAPGSVGARLNGLPGSVHSVVRQANGKVVVVGSFSTFAGSPRSGIVRLLATGAVDTTFVSNGAGFDSTVVGFGPRRIQDHALGLVVAGTFTNYQGQPKPGLVRLMADGTADPSFATGIQLAGPNRSIQAAIQSEGGGYFLGGDFTSYSGEARNRLIKVHSDGTPDSSFDVGSGFDGPVYALTKDADGRIIVGGQFTSFNGTPCGSIVRLNPDGSRDTGFSSAPGFQGQSAQVVSLATLADGQLVVGGQFSTYNGVARDGIARLLKDGGLDTSFDPGTGISGLTNRIVLGVTALPTGKYLINGRFLVYNGTSRGHAARLNANGTLDPTFVGGAGDFIRCLSVMPNGKIVAGGGFTRSIGVDQNRVARWSLEGTLDTSFNAGKNLDNAVRAMATETNGNVLVGGTFKSYGASSRSGIARLNPDGSLDAAFNPGTGLEGINASMEGMLLQSDGKLLIFGNFSAYNGAPRSHVARVFTRNSPAEPPLIESRLLPGGLLELRWPDVPGFALESVSDFSQQWVPVSNVTPAVGGIHIFTVPTDAWTRFFRLKQ